MAVAFSRASSVGGSANATTAESAESAEPNLKDRPFCFVHDFVSALKESIFHMFAGLFELFRIIEMLLVSEECVFFASLQLSLCAICSASGTSESSDSVTRTWWTHVVLSCKYCSKSD